jgi:hypothetical protein
MLSVAYLNELSIAYCVFLAVGYFTASFFSSHNRKSFKNAFPTKLCYLYLQSEGKEMHCFSFHFSCLSVYYALLSTDFIQYVFRNVFCAARTSPTTVLVLPKIPKPSRRPFLYFRNFRNVPNDSFGTFGISETSTTTIFVLSEFPKASRRPFWCFRKFRKSFYG